jgi:hypothetical protein
MTYIAQKWLTKALLGDTKIIVPKDLTKIKFDSIMFTYTKEI